MKKILVTGFEPFDGSQLNPSEEIVKALHITQIDGIELYTHVLPVDRHQAPGKIIALTEQWSPDIILLLGEATGRSVVSIERLAINLMDYRIPDNKGNRVEDEPIILDGPAAYFVSLPVKRIYEKIKNEGIPVELSLTAGAFLCNQVLYQVLHWLSDKNHKVLAGFIHVPSLPEQVCRRGTVSPSMSLETSLRAVRVALETLKEQE
jgi:pyroglutamyl-peptidase